MKKYLSPTVYYYCPDYKTYVKREECARCIWQQDIENLFIYKNKNLNMAKKTYVSPGIMLLQAGGDPGTGDLFRPSEHKDELAKPGQFDDFEDFNDDEFTSQL